MAILAISATPGAARVYAAGSCAVRCTIWNPSALPSGQALYNEYKKVELGLEFHSDVAGSISALRFYQDQAVTPISHVAHLWNASGILLATVTIPAGPGGWMQAKLATRVRITAGTSLWVSYYAADGLYDASVNWPYASGNAPLHATAAAYHHDADAFPDSPSLNNANYWVDVVFQPADQNDQGDTEQ